MVHYCETMAPINQSRAQSPEGATKRLGKALFHLQDPRPCQGGERLKQRRRLKSPRKRAWHIKHRAQRTDCPGVILLLLMSERRNGGGRLVSEAGESDIIKTAEEEGPPATQKASESEEEENVIATSESRVSIVMHMYV